MQITLYLNRPTATTMIEIIPFGHFRSFNESTHKMHFSTLYFTGFSSRITFHFQLYQKKAIAFWLFTRSTLQYECYQLACNYKVNRCLIPDKANQPVHRGKSLPPLPEYLESVNGDKIVNTHAYSQDALVARCPEARFWFSIRVLNSNLVAGTP